MAGRHGFDAFSGRGSIAIDRGRGRENNFIDMVILHAPEEVDGAGEIMLVVSEGLFDGFRNRFKTGEMND